MKAILKSQPEGPARKYYRITALGILHYEKQLNSWYKLKNGIEKILQRGDNDE